MSANPTRQPAKGPTAPPSQEDHRPSVQSAVKPGSRPANQTHERPDLRTSVRPFARSKRRLVIRYAFEFYQDQIELLRQINLQTKLGGDNLSMSEMVREALDEYITRKNLRPNERAG